ncbi:aminotransferase class V-fold PLP-dependent enzyme, partial [Micromonospora harpali]
MSASPVYLDAATAAPPHPVARQALLAALDDGWADPARLYGQARRARQLLDAAREAAAATLGVRADELSFTPSGTAAAHSAVLGGLAGRRRVGATLVHSAIEHSAVLHAAQRHVAGGGSAVSVPVDRLGRLDLDAFADAVRAPGVALAALIGASHEVGTVQPVAPAAAACAAAGVPLYVDAAQLVGRVPVPAGWSVLTASAHKWGGPPGVGLLVVRKGTRWESPWPADERESGRTPGVVNLPAVVAAAASLRAAAADPAAEAALLGPPVAGASGQSRRG